MDNGRLLTDTIHSGDDYDRLVGTADDETIYGDAGNDILTAEATGTDAPSR